MAKHTVVIDLDDDLEPGLLESTGSVTIFPSGEAGETYRTYRLLVRRKPLWRAPEWMREMFAGYWLRHAKVHDSRSGVLSAPDCWDLCNEQPKTDGSMTRTGNRLSLGDVMRFFGYTDFAPPSTDPEELRTKAWRIE